MEQCVQNKVAGGGGSVHVWGAFCKHGKCDLVILDQNVTGAVYRDILVKKHASLGSWVIWQHF